MATINTDIAQKIDIVIRENNSATINLNITTDTGSAFDLTDYTVSFSVISNGENLLNLTNGAGVLNPATSDGILDSTGKIVIAITNLQASIIPGTYKHKLVLTKNTVIQTWMYGKFKINED